MATSNSGPLDLSKYISGVTDRANQNWGRADDQFKWAQDTYNKDRAVSDKVSDRALNTQEQFADYATQDRKFWEDTYKPGMQEQMAFARGYTTPERMQANRGSAIAGVNLASNEAADRAKLQLASYGVDPSAGRYAGLDAGLQAKAAAGAAAAGQKSDRDTEMLGQEYLDRAIRTGAVLPGQVANQAGVSMAAGDRAVNTNLATTASGSSTMGTPMQWTGLGNDMFKEWSNAAQAETSAGLRGQELDIKRAEAKEKESSGVGAALGMGAGILGMVGNMAMPGVGGVASSIGGNLMSSLMSKKTARGGLITKMRAGGMVTNAPDEFDGDEDEEDPNVHRGYRPKVKDQPARLWQEPEDASEWNTTKDVPHNDDWVPGYQHGGSVYDSDDTGGGPLFNVDGQMETVGAVIPGGSGPRSDRRIERNDPQVGTGEEQTRGYHLAPTVGRRNHYLPDEEQYPAYQSQDKMRARELPNADAWAGSYAEGGEVEDDFVDTPDDDMMMPEGPSDQVVPPEASPSGGEETDDVHALLNEGEFVIPKDVVRWNGEKFFQKLIEKSYAEMKGPQVAEPEPGPPVQALAISPPSFQTAGG